MPPRDELAGADFVGPLLKDGQPVFHPGNLPPPQPFVFREITVDGNLVEADLVGNRAVDTGRAVTGPVVLTIPAGLTGTQPVLFRQKGAGTFAIAAGAGVTLDSPGGLLTIGARFNGAVLYPDGADTYLLAGNLV